MTNTYPLKVEFRRNALHYKYWICLVALNFYYLLLQYKFFLTTIKMETAFTKISKLWRNFASRTLSFLSNFLSKLKRYNFGGPKGKHLAPPKFPPPSNQTPLPPIFSHFFSILLISSPTKQTISNIMVQVAQTISGP